ncbi:hypothetical protein GCM10022408_34340 [Hymenobacter fastidiosus]|uniref:Zf-HC2 domain-containing protein n=1 Tax=Hymenobacter fastidiosus TaxID=486264 RepID=A0ABP7SX37_9BACT
MSAFFNCDEATLLIEKRAERPLSLAPRLSLWFHLLMCVLCRRYARQTAVVAQLARRLGRGDASAEKLSVEARARLELLVRDAGYGGTAAR